MSNIDITTAMTHDDHGGAIRDSFDPRDEYFVPNPMHEVASSRDLRSEVEAIGKVLIYYQGTTRTCTANAAAAVSGTKNGSDDMSRNGAKKVHQGCSSIGSLEVALMIVSIMLTTMERTCETPSKA